MQRARVWTAGLALALAGCGGGGGERATLRVDVVGRLDDPASPVRAVLTQSTQLGLVQFDGAGQIVPGLAASWRVVDGGRSLIFRLRPAKWPDGRALAASDVVAAFRKIMLPGSRNPLKPLLAGIDNAAAVAAGRAPAAMLGVTAPLADVVEVRLASPDAGLLQLLALPAAAVLRGEPRASGNGAFRVVDAAARPLRLTANPRYFAAAATQLGGVVLTAAAEPAVAIDRFVRGETDLVVGDGIAGLGEARARVPARNLRIEATWGVYGYRVNLKAGPLADARVRRALAMTVDRADLVGRLFAIPTMVPLVSLVPPDASRGGVVTVPDWAPLDGSTRRALAIQLLGAAGFDAAHPLTLRLSLPPGREHAQIADAVARGWAGLGVTVTTFERAPSAQRAAIARGDYDLALVERSAPAPRALFFLRPFTCAAGDYCNSGADALIEGARAITDEAARDAALAHAEATMLADTPMIPLFVPVRWTLVGRQVSGWTENTGGQHPLSALGLSKDTRP